MFSLSCVTTALPKPRPLFQTANVSRTCDWGFYCKILIWTSPPHHRPLTRQPHLHDARVIRITSCGRTTCVMALCCWMRVGILYVSASPIYTSYSFALSIDRKSTYSGRVEDGKLGGRMSANIAFTLVSLTVCFVMLKYVLFRSRVEKAEYCIIWRLWGVCLMTAAQ